MTTHRLLAALSALLIAALVPTTALAHDGDNMRDDVTLHVGTLHESCYFDLHSELTTSEFQTFAAEGGQILRFRQLSGADTLGAGTFDVSLGYQVFFLDDTKGAWNNTMSHPDADHYLGHVNAVPFLTLRVGVARDVDLEAWGTVNPVSNFGFVGVASKIRILRQSEHMPVSVAVRPSISGLIGPTEVQAWNFSTDLSVSHDFDGFAPFVGVTSSSTVAIDTSDDTDVGIVGASRLVGSVGLDFHWRFLSAAVQAEISDLPGVTARVGGRF